MQQPLSGVLEVKSQLLTLLLLLLEENLPILSHGVGCVFQLCLSGLRGCAPGV